MSQPRKVQLTILAIALGLTTIVASITFAGRTEGSVDLTGTWYFGFDWYGYCDDTDVNQTGGEFTFQCVAGGTDFGSGTGSVDKKSGAFSFTFPGVCVEAGGTASQESMTGEWDWLQPHCGSPGPWPFNASRVTPTPCPDFDADTICDYADADLDGDGCPNVRESVTGAGAQNSGGNRNSYDPHDYFNPSHDGQNRVDDIVLVLQAYFKDDNDANPGLPPYAPGYNPDTDRTLAGPNLWSLGPPNGLQRVDDIVNILNHYFHDCA